MGDVSFYLKKCGLAGAILHVGLHGLILYRAGHFLYNSKWRKINPLWYLYLLVVNLYRIVFKIELPETAIIGKRLFLPHPYGLVMGGNTRIGDDCTIGPWVVIGHNGTPGADPVIHDCVYIAPHACVLGQIHIQSGAFIGANCVVKNNIDKGQTVRN